VIIYGGHEMNIPAPLQQQIQEGKVMLFLGSGASKGAEAADDSYPPDGKQLANILSTKFLGGEELDKQLSIIAELAESETDLLTLQEFIKDLFIKFKPADFHKLIPTFQWAAIASTNYDLIIERAYESCKKPVQELVPFYKNSDRVDSKLRTYTSVPYVKLHGCVSKWEDRSIPLILTIDQYVTHRRNRDTLFQRLKQYASEYTVVFVGHSLEDSDLRQLLLELSEDDISRPRYYTVTPNPSERQKRFWETKKISALDGTFQDFLESLNTTINVALRGIVFSATQHALETKIIRKDTKFSPETLKILESDVDYLTVDFPSKPITPKDFYKGYSFGWASIQQNLDSKRTLTDTLLSDLILVDDVDRVSYADFYMIRGHAGSGKTIILKRIAWDAAASFNKICLYWKSSNKITVDFISEIIELIGQRIFLFVDKVSDHIPDMISLMKTAKTRKLPITVIGAERSNEWNIECSQLEQHVSDFYDVRYLSHKEVLSLLEKLDQHKSLGILEQTSKENQIKAFEHKAGRQLLVALHEATQGDTFENILVDEFNNIEPELARSIYLTICTLNRIDVPVRAGIIKRLHGVAFEDFQEKFFKPLEYVVHAEPYKPARTMAYRTRHPWIAEVIFERMLPLPLDRVDLYMKIFDELDIGYDADRKAFRELIKVKDLLKLFPDNMLIMKLFDKARKFDNQDGYFHQQLGIFEMKRSNPNLDNAYEELQLAKKYAPWDKSVIHSLSELEIVRSHKANTDLEKEKHLSSARTLALSLTGRDADTSYGYHTLAKISLERLEVQLINAPENDSLISDSIKNVEQIIQDGLQRFPGDEYLLESESRLAKMIKDDKRAILALEKAFKVNNLSPYVAIGLARLYEVEAKTSDARKTLEICLEGLPADKMLNGALAMLIMKYFCKEQDNIEYYLRRSFTDGDANYYSQFWYARQLYINRKYDDSRNYFKKLKDARVSPKVKNEIRGPIFNESSVPVRVNGNVQRLEATYAFVSREGYSDCVFVHRSKVNQNIWDDLYQNAPVEYSLGFTFGGPAGFELIVRQF
jgi:cold shock CspA family protein